MRTPMLIVDPLPVDARGDLVEFVVGRVGQGVDVGGQTRGRGGIDTGDMVVYAYLHKVLARVPVLLEILLLPSRVTNYLFVGGFDWLFDQVNQIWRAEFAQG
jgi:hypothetical protein